MSTMQTVMDRPASDAQNSARTPYTPGLVLAVIVTCQLMLVLDATVVNIALPQIQDDLRISAANASWMLSAYMLAFGGLLLLGGRVGDMFGRRRAFLGGLSLFTAASLLGGLASSADWLIALRAVQGIGAAFAAPSALSLIATNFAEGNPRNRALSIYSAVSAAGGSIGLLLGGFLTAVASWRWVFFINVPIGLAVVLIGWRIIVEPERNPGRLDVAGALTSTAGMVALVYGFIRAASNGWGDAMTWGWFVIALALLTLFVSIELRVGQPIMPLRLFADRNRASAYVNMLLIPATMFGVFFFLTQFLQNALGYGPLVAGVAFLPMTLTMFTTVRILPRLLPVIGPKPILVFGATLIAASLAWLTQISASSGYLTGILGPTLLLGLGVGCSFLPLNVVILSGVRREDSGAASGALQTMQQVGASLGVAILVTVFGTASRAAAAHPLVHASVQAQGRLILAMGVESVFRVGVFFPLLALGVAIFAITATRTTRQPALQADSSDEEARISVPSLE